MTEAQVETLARESFATREQEHAPGARLPS